MMKTFLFGGYKVECEENAIYGMAYLRDKIDTSERKVYFDEAKRKGYAEFEDQSGHNFTLEYDSNNKYTVIRR